MNDIEFSKLLGPNFRRYFKNTSWLVFDKGLALVINFLVAVYVTRYLGPSNYGLLSYAISFVAIFAVIAPLGLDLILIRNLVRFPDRKPSLMGTAFGLKILGSLAALGAVMTVLHFSDNDASTKTLVSVVAAGILFQPLTVIDAYFQSKILSKYTVYVRLSQTIISGLLKCYFVATSAPLLWFAVVVFVENFVLGLGLFFVYLRRRYSVSSWRFDSRLARELLRSSFPLLISGIAISIYMRIDQLMIKGMIGTHELGNYAVAVGLCEIGYYVPAAIVSTLFPTILSFKDDPKAYSYNLQRFYDLMTVLALATAGFLFFAGDKVILLLYGHEFDQAAAVIKIYSWTVIPVFLAMGSVNWFLTDNLEKYILYRTLMGAAVNIVLNLFLIPAHGIAGAAVATLAAQTVTAYVSLMFFKPCHSNFYAISNSFNLIRALRNLKLLR
jgi:O-antigen/teichoic acid export membrane protein